MHRQNLGIFDENLQFMQYYLLNCDNCEKGEMKQIK